MPVQKRRSVTVGLFVVAAIIAAGAWALAGPTRKTVPTEEPAKGLEPPRKTPRPVPKIVDVTTPPKVEPTPQRPQPPIPPKTPVAKRKPRPKVDVVFALDTTGSMGGLIAGARRKIWSIANRIVNGNPRPHVRIGLVGYRDIGDAYVTRRYALTANIDDVYRRLRRFRADGGGDTPEHVNRALADSIRRMRWRQGQDVLKLIFLVGDAPPHEGRSGLYSASLAREARRKGIVINAVRCGRMHATARAWRRIAQASGGMYASIRQDGGMLAIRTPVDRELADLNRKLTATALFTGKRAERAAARRRAIGNSVMDALGQAESATYRARSGHLDSQDLLTQMRRGRRISSVAPAALPAPLRKLSPAARSAYVAKLASTRAKLRRKILKLAKKRDAYVRRARKAKPRARAFDDAIGSALKAQGARAHIAY